MHAFNSRPNAQYFEEQTAKGLADLDVSITEDTEDELAVLVGKQSEHLDDVKPKKMMMMTMMMHARMIDPTVPENHFK